MDRSPGSVCCPGTTAVGAGEGGARGGRGGVWGGGGGSGGGGGGRGRGGGGGGGGGGGLGGGGGARGGAGLGGAGGAEDQVIHAATTANTPSNATAARPRPPMRLVAATGSWSASGITRGRHVGRLASSRPTSGVTPAPPPPPSSIPPTTS